MNPDDTEERYTYYGDDQVKTKELYFKNDLVYTERYNYSKYSQSGVGSVSKISKTIEPADGSPAAAVTTYLDSRGNTWKTEVTDGTDTRTTTATYDYRNNLLTQTDPMGNISSYEYVDISVSLR